MKLETCRVLITGASGGIGQALVEQLCAAGAQVLAVRVTGQTGKAYDAVATISHAGKNRDIPLKIVVDGVNLEWFSGDGAFDFLVPVLPAPSASPATAARLPTVSPRVDQIPR